MIKYKVKISLFSILVFLSLGLKQFSISGNELSLWTFFLNISKTISLDLSMLFIVTALLFLLFEIFLFIFSILQKEPKFKLKIALITLIEIITYSLLLFILWPALHQSFQISIGAYLTLLLMVVSFIFKLWLPLPQIIVDRSIDNTDNEDKKLTEANQGSEPVVSKKHEIQLQEPNNFSVIQPEPDTFDGLSSNAKINLKQLSKAVFLINIALFTSFFMVWNSNITKEIGVVIFLSGNGFFDFLSRVLMIFSLHIIISNILFFTAPHYFIPASIINNIYYILMWLRAIKLIGFVNIAFAPLVGIALAIFSLIFIISTIRKINLNQPKCVNLKDDFKGYFKAFFNSCEKAIQTISMMMRHWKDE